ncbi:hypothetical protein K501DRAFT_154781, partial [Backusella circina FSU 941]
ITHSQAACIFYGDPSTTENQMLNEAKIAAIQDVEFCYIDTPSEPYLLASKRINFFPFKYKRYRHAELSSQSELFEETIEEVDNETEDNLIEFINNVFLINDPQNEEVYEHLYMSSDQIFSITKQHTSLYQDK